MSPDSTGLILLIVSMAMFMLMIISTNVNERGLRDRDVPIFIIFGSLITMAILLMAITVFLKTSRGG